MPTMTYVDTHAAMAALPASAGQVVFLNEEGREGEFECVAGQMPADYLNGLNVASSTSGFYYRRIWNNIEGHPEWFYDGLGDWEPALTECLRLCPVVCLRARDYYVATTWKIQRPYRSVIAPVLSDGYAAGDRARIVGLDTSKPVIQVGPNVKPNLPSDFMRNLLLRGFAALHDGPRTLPPLGGNLADAVPTFRMQYILESHFEHLLAAEPLVGFSMHGLVGTRLKWCRVTRGLTFGGNDQMIGFIADGRQAVLAGGNASLYLDYCRVEMGGISLPNTPVGLWLYGAITDTFIREFETSKVADGIRVTGSGASTSGVDNLDVHIHHPVLDQCSSYAIQISDLGKRGMVEIVDAYAAITPAATYCIRANQNGGSIRIIGGQLICTETNNSIGLSAEHCASIKIDGAQFLDFGRPVVIDQTTNFQADPIVNNVINAGPFSQAAVWIRGCKNGHVSPIIRAESAIYPQGVYLAANLNARVTVDVSSIDPLSVVSATLVAINGVAVTAGYYDSTGVAVSSTTSGANFVLGGAA